MFLCKSQKKRYWHILRSSDLIQGSNPLVSYATLLPPASPLNLGVTRSSVLGFLSFFNWALLLVPFIKFHHISFLSSPLTFAPNPRLIYSTITCTIPTWWFNKHLKLNMWTELLICPPQIVSPQFSSISVNDTMVYLVVLTKNKGILLDFSHLPPMFTSSAHPDGPHHLSPGLLRLPPNCGELPNKNTGCPDKFKFQMNGEWFYRPRRKDNKAESFASLKSVGDNGGGHGGWSWVVTLPVSLLFEVTHCYGLQVDGVFGLVGIMSSFKPCPPFLRSPSEMGSLPSWPQLPFQLAVPCGLMATRNPWAPVLLCATLRAPPSLWSFLEQSRGYRELGWVLQPLPVVSSHSLPISGKSQKIGRQARALLQVRGHRWSHPMVSHHASL